MDALDNESGENEPGPIRVVLVDLDRPEVRLDGDPRYESAWLVGCRGGVPEALVEVPLEPGASTVADDQLALLVAAADHASVPVRSVVSDAALPSITVVVPSIVARHDELERCLAGFDALDYPDFEVVVVDNRRVLPADDPLPGLLAGRERVRSVRAPRPGISAARNAGIEAALGDVVVFTDDDVHVDPQWLRAFGRRLAADPALQAVTGLILPAELETPAQVWFERYYGGFSGERTFAPLDLAAGRGPLGRARVTVRDASGAAIRTFALYGVGAYGAGANMAFRREALVRLGGYDLALGTGTPARGGEDLATLIDVLWAGGKVGYEPAAVVFHQHRREYAQLLHQLRGNGLGFTAMLTSLVVKDPWHLVGLGAQLPLALSRMGVQTLARVRGRRAGRPDEDVAAPLYPRALVSEELRGMPSGPLAYLRSRRAVRAWSGGATTPS